MSGQNGPDEAARLERALARIARATSRLRAQPALHGAPTSATQPPGGTDAAIIAARLDHLIAEIRALLGPHEF